MRLITRKIYRAFPELDKFSDEQCQRFLKAANASISRRVARAMVGVAAAMLMAVVAIDTVVPVAQEFSDRWRLDEPAYWLLWGTLLTLALLVSFVPGLVVTDVLLRLRVRSLLKRCGACPLCRYSLLGIRVGSDLIVTCPECGHTIKVEPALGELATDESGAAVYKPEIVRDDETSIARRKRRRIRIMRWSGSIVCAILVLVGGGVGCYVWFVNQQAVAARAAREPASKMREIQAAALGARAGDDEEAMWREFVRIIGGPQNVVNQQSRVPGVGPLMYSQNWDTGPLRKLSTLPADSPIRRMPDGQRETQRRALRAVLDQCLAEGVFVRLESLKDFRGAMRPLPDTSKDSPAGAYDPMEAGAAYMLANVQTARMIDAVSAGDLEEYLKSVDETLQVADIFDRQLALADRSAASALRGLLLRGILQDVQEYPDTTWHAAVMKMLAARESRPAISASLRVHQYQSRDHVNWFFSDPNRVRESALGLSQFMDNPSLSGLKAPRMTVGTRRENLEVLDAVTEFWIEQAGKPYQERSTLPPSDRGLTLVGMSTQWLSQLINFHETAGFQYRAVMVTIAVERFRRERGRLPSTSEMSTLDIPAEYLIDPTNGKPFGLRQTPLGSPHPLPFEVVGGDTGLADPQEPEPAP